MYVSGRAGNGLRRRRDNPGSDAAIPPAYEPILGADGKPCQWEPGKAEARASKDRQWLSLGSGHLTISVIVVESVIFPDDARTDM